MKNYYTILSKVLDTDYQLRAAVKLLDTLEAAYSEEEQFELKALATVIKGYLCDAERCIKSVIEDVDVMAAENRGAG